MKLKRSIVTVLMKNGKQDIAIKMLEEILVNLYFYLVIIIKNIWPKFNPRGQNFKDAGDQLHGEGKRD